MTLRQANSNQYPRLPWERHPDASRPGFVAYPHGPYAGSAYVYFNAVGPRATPWAWCVRWPGRFASNGALDGRQAAADLATTAYWDGVSATEGWRAPAPRPAVASPDLTAELFWQRLDEWLANSASRDAVVAQIHRYRRAVLRGPSIIGPGEDRRIWSRLSDSLAQLQHGSS